MAGSLCIAVSCITKYRESCDPVLPPSAKSKPSSSPQFCPMKTLLSTVSMCNERKIMMPSTAEGEAFDEKASKRKVKKEYFHNYNGDSGIKYQKH